MTDAPLALVIFDVDGTLVDSQRDILAAMKIAFDRAALSVPSKSDVLGIVGLSLDEALAELAPTHPKPLRDQLVQDYKDAYVELRSEVGVSHSSPLYSGAREVLNALHAVPHILLGIATGKSRKGVDKMIEGHALEGMFVTQQVADFHPSKPNPSMIFQAMQDTGVDADRVVMVGDTEFDMEMAAAAGVTGIAVNWGYHGVDRLGAASHTIDSFAELPPLLNRIWEVK